MSLNDFDANDRDNIEIAHNVLNINRSLATWKFIRVICRSL